MRWWQNHFDVITILIIWRQDCRKEKEELKETMALEVVTDDNLGTTKLKRMTGICTQQENTGRDMCFGLCVAFFLY